MRPSQGFSHEFSTSLSVAASCTLNSALSIADRDPSFRQALRYLCRNTTLPESVRVKAQIRLAQMHCYTRATQIKNRCIMGGLGRSVFREFKMARVCWPLPHEHPSIKSAFRPLRPTNTKTPNEFVLTIYRTVSISRECSRWQDSWGEEGELVMLYEENIEPVVALHGVGCGISMHFSIQAGFPMCSWSTLDASAYLPSMLR